MNAKQAIKMWHERETVDALQPWEVAEMLDALTMRVEEFEAAQHSVQRTCARCGNSGKPITDIGGNQSCPECGASR